MDNKTAAQNVFFVTGTAEIKQITALEKDFPVRDQLNVGE